jgi:hypothetical protein
MTNLIRLAEEAQKSQHEKQRELALAVLPILTALEEEAKKPCVGTLPGCLTLCRLAGFPPDPDRLCRRCWSRHLIGGE